MSMMTHVRGDVCCCCVAVGGFVKAKMGVEGNRVFWFKAGVLSIFIAGFFIEQCGTETNFASSDWFKASNVLASVDFIKESCDDVRSTAESALLSIANVLKNIGYKTSSQNSMQLCAVSTFKKTGKHLYFSCM